ncbi:MAG: hypothetical protein R2864_06305 [Syntrophotaleaceae bacterium]
MVKQHPDSAEGYRLRGLILMEQEQESLTLPRYRRSRVSSRTLEQVRFISAPLTSSEGNRL